MQDETTYLSLQSLGQDLFHNPADAPVRVVSDADSIRGIEEETGLSCGVLFKDSRVALLRDAVILPDGSRGTYLRVIPASLRPGAVVVPLLPDGRFVLLRHFRHATRDWLLEFPRGFAEPGESPEETARRELKEETGLDVDGARLQRLGYVHPDSGLQAGRVNCFLAQIGDCDEGDIAPVDKLEGIDGILLLSRAELEQKIATGQIVDGFTLSALTLMRAGGKKRDRAETRVFLGGTCNGSRWRDELVPQLEIGYFNPVVEDWDAGAARREREERERDGFLLYVFTPLSEGGYSIAEVVDDSNKRPERTIMCIVHEDAGKVFSEHQEKALRRVGEMVERNGGRFFDSLSDVAEYLNRAARRE